jgi:hypothetical protein
MSVFHLRCKKYHSRCSYPDAANDAHAGYVIYMTLMSMMPPLVPQPHVKCYAFGSVSGRLCDPSGSTWQPLNPDYDPGPPPPPRKPRPERQRPENANTDQHNSTTSTISQNCDANSTPSLSQLASSPPGGAVQQRNVRDPRGNNSSAMHLQSQSSQTSAQSNPRRPRRQRKKSAPLRLPRAREESKTSSSKHAEQKAP